MAETFTRDGLDYLYNAGVRDVGDLPTYWVGLFVSQSATTVPASTASGSASGWTEMTATSGTYARQSIAASAIAAAGDVGGSGRGSTWPNVTFTGFVGASPANGAVILSSSVASLGSPMFFTNFDSETSRSFANTADSLTFTPRVHMLP